MTNAVSDLLRNFDALTEEYNRHKREVTEQLKPNFHSIFKPYLESHPIIENVSFTAYTPYFNDGDECIYSVSELNAQIEGFDDDEWGFFGTYSSYDAVLDYLQTGKVPESTWKPHHYDTYREYWIKSSQPLIELGIDKLTEIVTAQKAGIELQRTMNSIPEDVIRDMFGDHVKVTIDRDGVTTEDYDHD